MNLIMNPADLLLPGVGPLGALWVGSLYALNKEFLSENRISVVISLTPCLRQRDIEHYYFDINDSKRDQDRLDMYLPFILRIIHSARSRGYNVLLHCRMGVQRAPTVAAYYLWRYCGYTMAEACRRLVQSRPVAFYHGTYWTFSMGPAAPTPP